MSFHKDSLDANNHTLTAFTYDDITARDADTAFQVTASINKMVRVDSPASYFILQSLSPTVWSEVQQAGNALLKTGGAMTGAITTNSTFDGVDVGERDGVLTTTTATANAALPKAGGTLTGDVTLSTGETLNVNIDLVDELLPDATGEVILHSGNTGAAVFAEAFSATPANEVLISPSSGAGVGNITHKTTGTTAEELISFVNGNGLIGGVVVSGTATAYNTSSDPRLKSFKELPSDDSIDKKFKELYSTFRVFNWKTDPNGVLVWGHDAHACIDAGLGMASEGRGSRDAELGDIEKGVLVTPAGVDQSKAVPILIAKIEQLERRLKALEK